MVPATVNLELDCDSSQGLTVCVVICIEGNTRYNIKNPIRMDRSISKFGVSSCDRHCTRHNEWIRILGARQFFEEEINTHRRPIRINSSHLNGNSRPK